MNKRQFKDIGIIIKQINYKETDKLLTIYLKQNGKIIARIKGIRRIKSKYSSHVNLLNNCKFDIYNKNNYFIITHIDTVSPYINIKKNFNKIKQAYYILEIFNKITELQNPNETLYLFLNKTLNIINQSDNTNILNAYMIKILNISGFYSSITHNKYNKNIINYLNFLKNTNYENIINDNTSTKYSHQAFQILRDKIEDVLETKIKTKLIYQNSEGLLF